MYKSLLMIPLLYMQLNAKSKTEKIGDVLATALPLVALSSTFYTNDKKGRDEFYKSYGSTMLTTVALKYTVREKRPDNNDRDSFPSGHTSSAISSAVFIYKDMV